ncbi:MAG: hypothetical protein MZV70_50425 [Desulfobacterales bacterium]|nr:hypothetical protein [Desulfobacterales bacterium]
MLNVVGRPVDGLGPVSQREDAADPPRRPDVHRAGHHRARARNRRQGHRPAGALPPRRQDGHVRRRRRGQDRRHDGDGPQHRHAARRHLRLRRRGRAHP